MSYNFVTVRLGKDSVPEIQCLCSSSHGVLNEGYSIVVKCTQVPENYKEGDYAFIWLGSDNNKGTQTKWKQGFKAFGKIKSISRGLKYNDISETEIDVLYIFKESINRLDILRDAASAYYWCSGMPLIGIDDHANQTIRSISGEELCDIGAFFWSLEKVTKSFRRDIITINPGFEAFFKTRIPNPQLHPNLKSISAIPVLTTTNLCSTPYRPYLTAIKSKPFLLLAGISGTGKSRIVRELARACWEVGSDEYLAQKPSNFEMVQVKPNWHDSSELIGYVSRINGEKYIVGPFLKFLVKALQNPDIPHFLCLDEMNLAPVEQYFAEYLSVVESRRVNEDGEVETDPIVDFEATDAYKSLIDQLFVGNEDERRAYLTEENGKRLTLPANLIVVGTVNMDETTFSFSRKVLDRAMTIEMNEVDLYGGLLERHEPIGKIGPAELTGEAVEGADVYRNHQEVCDMALDYLGSLNRELEGTPFKVAYRTRNEFLLYVVNNLPYNRDAEGNELPLGYVVARALDEITCMKVLSRIEGDETKVQDELLNKLMAAIEAGLKEISDEEHPVESVSLRKLREMKQRLASGYTSFWS